MAESVPLKPEPGDAVTQHQHTTTVANKTSGNTTLESRQNLQTQVKYVQEQLRIQGPMRELLVLSKKNRRSPSRTKRHYELLDQLSEFLKWLDEKVTMSPAFKSETMVDIFIKQF